MQQALNRHNKPNQANYPTAINLYFRAIAIEFSSITGDSSQISNLTKIGLVSIKPKFVMLNK